MFLSRIELSPQAAVSDVFWREVSKPYGAHQALWRLFGSPEPQPRSFLFRHEESAGRPAFLVLSASQPVEGVDSLWRLETREFRPALRVGQLLGFRLRASPVVQRRPRGGAEGRRSRRHDIVMDLKRRTESERRALASEQELIFKAGSAWLRAQGERAGFALCDGAAEVLGPDGLLETRQAAPALRVEGYRQHRIRRGGAGDAPIRFSTLDFEGVLEVREPDAFLRAVTKGFGPEKAFGCGLMLLRRA